MKYKQYDDVIHIHCILCKKESTFLFSYYYKATKANGAYIHVCPHCSLRAELELEIMISEVWFREIPHKT